MGQKISELTTTTTLTGTEKIPVSNGGATALITTPDDIAEYVENKLEPTFDLLGISDIPEFSSTTQYVVSDIVKHTNANGVPGLYRFIINHKGAWTESDTEPTNIATELKLLHNNTTTQQVSVTPIGTFSGDVTLTLSYGSYTETLTLAANTTGTFTQLITKGDIYTVYASAVTDYTVTLLQTVKAVTASKNIIFNYVPTTGATLNETLKVYFTASTGTSNNTPFLNKDCTVVYSNGTTQGATITASGGLYVASFTIPYGTTYQVHAPLCDGFALQAPSTEITAAQTNRIVTFGAYTKNNVTWGQTGQGVLLVGSDGTEYIPGNYNGSASDIVAVHIVFSELLEKFTTYGRGDFYLATPTGRTTIATSTLSWAGSNVAFYSLPYKTSDSTAKSDMDGMLNTEKIIQEGDYKGISTNAADWCRNQTLTINGVAKKGFLLSYGQFRTLGLTANSDHRTELSTALAVIGYTISAYTSGRWWTSSLDSAALAVGMDYGSFYNISKTGSYSVLPGFA